MVLVSSVIVAHGFSNHKGFYESELKNELKNKQVLQIEFHSILSMLYESIICINNKGLRYTNPSAIRLIENSTRQLEDFNSSHDNLSSFLNKIQSISSP